MLSEELLAVDDRDYYRNDENNGNSKGYVDQPVQRLFVVLKAAYVRPEEIYQQEKRRQEYNNDWRSE